MLIFPFWEILFQRKPVLIINHKNLFKSFLKVVYKSQCLSAYIYNCFRFFVKNLFLPNKLIVRSLAPQIPNKAVCKAKQSFNNPGFHFYFELLISLHKQDEERRTKHLFRLLNCEKIKTFDRYSLKEAFKNKKILSLLDSLGVL